MDLWCERQPEDADAIEALAGRLAEHGGGRVPLAEVVPTLPRRVRRTWAPGLRARRALALDRADNHDPRWFPQGITSSADAGPDGWTGDPLLVASSYARPRADDPARLKRGQGSRLTVLDLERRRYGHVLLVRATAKGLQPVTVHAGGVVWRGPFVHVAATARGFVTADVRDLLRVGAGAGLDTFGHDLVLPVRWRHRYGASEGTEPLRCSFLSWGRPGHGLPDASDGADGHLVTGEYAARRGATRRLATIPLGADHLPEADERGRTPITVVGDGPVGMQGAAVLRGRWHTSVSHSMLVPGTLHDGRPGALRGHTAALPPGPEDLTAWPGETPADDRLWTVTEHPWRRWFVEVRPRG